MVQLPVLVYCQETGRIPYIHTGHASALHMQMPVMPVLLQTYDKSSDSQIEDRVAIVESSSTSNDVQNARMKSLPNLLNVSERATAVPLRPQRRNQQFVCTTTLKMTDPIDKPA
jgi:hypothetical protein